MPTVLPTLPSPPEVRTPQAPTRSARTPGASQPSFPETLGEKRRAVGDDAIADPAVPSRASDAAGEPPPTAVGTPLERQGTTVTPADTAQSGRDDAQSLPTAVRGAFAAVAAMPAEPEFVGNIGETPEPGPSASASGSASAAQAPGSLSTAGSQPGSVPASVNQTVPTPAETAPAARRVELPVQKVQAGVDQPQPLRQSPPAAPPSGPGHAAAEGDRQTSGAESRFAGLGEESGTRHQPAMGRAMQVQAAVAVENATGLTPPAAPGVHTGASVTGLVNADVQAPLPVIAGLELDDAQATGRVVRGLTSMLAQRGGAMTMRLEPPGLGQLRVEMTVVRGTVTVQFQPTTAEAQALLDRSIATLRSALESQGLTVERLTVHPAPPSNPARETADDQSQQHHASRHHADAGDGRSRGRGDEQSGHGSANHRFTASFADAIESPAADSREPLEVLSQGAEAA